MLAAQISGSRGPTLILMHFLGGSAREWQEVVAGLGDRKAVSLDLPGFGDSAEVPGYTVAAMVDAVEQTIAGLGVTTYVLVGHSMSGKVAAVIASRRPAGLQGMVLVAPSPLGPEPIGEQKRVAMLESLGEVREGDFERAGQYVTKNEARVLAPAVQARATEDVLRMNRAAWRAWIELGSREDWSGKVDRLELPALVVVGTKDTSLGRPVQERLTLPFLTQATLVEVPDCGHLIPMEKPVEMAGILEEFLGGLNAAVVPAGYLKFIQSERVSERTRELLLARLEPRAEGPLALSAGQMETLRAVVDRVIPQDCAGVEKANSRSLLDDNSRSLLDGYRGTQCSAAEREHGLLDGYRGTQRSAGEKEHGLVDDNKRAGNGNGSHRFPTGMTKGSAEPETKIDIAGFIDERLASGQGDGWRYDLLPADREAYGLGLDALDEMALMLHERRFAALAAGQQDDLLTQIAVQGPMERPQLSRWFEDVRADAAQIWMAHPATLARIGYSGIGVGGAHTRYAGFVAIGPGVVEDWEPEPELNAGADAGVRN